MKKDDCERDYYKEEMPAPVAFFIIIFISILLIFFLQGTKHIQLENETTIQVETETDNQWFLELHFGNGETYIAKVEKVVASTFAPRVAFLDNGYRYSFEEGYKFEYDEDTNTYHLYLWRDEPYVLEKELFKKSEQSNENFSEREADIHE